MDKITILEQIRSNNNLLSLPQVLSEIIKETSKEDFSGEKLSTIILKDPSLTGKILKMSNSSFYNRLSEIKTVQQAISVMGVTTVKCLALSSSVFNPKKIEKDTGVDAKQFFGYILSVAEASKKIAVAINYKSPDEVFIAGLLHDIGHMFLMHYYPIEFSKIIKNDFGLKQLVDVEKEIFGIDHSEISKEIAKVWNLPEDIIQAINEHHKLDSNTENKIQLIVKLAVLLSKDRFSGFEIPMEIRLEGISELSTKLDLDKKVIDEISSSLLVDTLEFAEYLGVDIGNLEDMLTLANQEIWKSYLCIENLFKERQELTKSLLKEEHHRGAIESKNIAMATLSHYLNNAVMAIFGRTQLARMYLKKGQEDIIIKNMPVMIDKIDISVRKIVAVIEEMKEVSPIDQKKFDSMSKAMNIDDLIENRLEQMEKTALEHDLIDV